MNNFFRFFPFTPTPGQQKACDMISSFLDNDSEVFILQGYAGTGKTTLVKAIIGILGGMDRPFVLMASTGRAARVLSLKTGNPASTIHSTIYKIDKLKSVIGEESRKIAFSLRNNSDNKDTVYFIDESSMIADRVESNPDLIFDDGRFLQHIFSYTAKRKIIFIGDTAQLPPVNCSASAALDQGYLIEKYGMKTESFCLTEVMRQVAESGIISNATRLRTQLGSPLLPPPALEVSLRKDLIVTSNIWDSIKRYSATLKRDSYSKAIMLTFSNGAVHYLNSQVRKNIFMGDAPSLQKEELLMVIHNNSAFEYFNGQHIRLKSINGNTKSIGPVELVKATVEDPETSERREVWLILNLLYRKEPSLTTDEENSLMKDFAIRMKKEGIKQGTDDYISCLVHDPWLNGLRVKFGYAVTCHKAQGGEWPDVYLNLEPALENISREAMYRWLYTAITRTSERLIVTNHKMLY